MLHAHLCLSCLCSLLVAVVYIYVCGCSFYSCVLCMLDVAIVYCSSPDSPPVVSCLSVLDAREAVESNCGQTSRQSKLLCQQLSTNSSLSSSLGGASPVRRCSCGNNSSSRCFVCIAKRRHSEISEMEETHRSVMHSSSHHAFPIEQEPGLTSTCNSHLVRSNSHQSAIADRACDVLPFPGHAQLVTAQVHNEIQIAGQNSVLKRGSIEQTDGNDSSYSTDPAVSRAFEPHSSSDGNEVDDEDYDEEDEDEENEDELVVRSAPVSVLPERSLAWEVEMKVKAMTFHGVWNGEHDSGFQVGSKYNFVS